MREYDLNPLLHANVTVSWGTYQAVKYLQQQSLAHLRSSQECIRRTDSVLAQLASVWITRDSVISK